MTRLQFLLSWVAAFLPFRSAKPVLQGFRFHYFGMDPRPKSIGIAAIFKDSEGNEALQGVVLPRTATVAEVGRALEQLGRFLQNPDERMRCRDEALSGFELNQAEYPWSIMEKSWEYPPKEWRDLEDTAFTNKPPYPNWK